MTSREGRPLTPAHSRRSSLPPHGFDHVTTLINKMNKLGIRRPAPRGLGDRL